MPLALLIVTMSGAFTGLAQKPAGPIQITGGGVYSGNWTSNDPKVAAVSIHTDAPVVIRNSVIGGRGNLIQISGVKTGANVTVENVVGAALDPGVSGRGRESFVEAIGFNSLVVRNCTIRGTGFGVRAVGASPSTLIIANNLALNLEDRASDGNGGVLPVRPWMGHFVILHRVNAPNGADIGWNQIVQTMGQTSTEDAINIYESQGSKAHPIWVHDNYIEGTSSAIPGRDYTGTALITDGDSGPNAVPTAYVIFDNNVIVQTSGSGIGIAYGHDITARANRVVSCGRDSSGKQYAWGASAAFILNYYKSPQFYNNTIIGTTGGMVGPGPNNKPTAYNEFVGTSGKPDPSNFIRGSRFTDPCLSGGGLNLHAEDIERKRWVAKVAAAHELIGDQGVRRTEQQ
jgi:hypothetical protein